MDSIPVHIINILSSKTIHSPVIAIMGAVVIIIVIILL